nr:hypothetical protein [Tanacetum cinerariifolium]
KHLDWITVRRDDDKLYTFKEGDFNRLRIQDIKDMLLLLVQGKLTNLTVEECLAFNVSLRMFTKSIVIQRHVEDLQLGVESYQKKLNLTKPDTYRSDLKIREAYTAYSNPRGFIYQNKDKKNRLMRIDELHKFSDGTLNDVRTALDDCLKGIWMKYLPQTIWRQSDRDKAGAMIWAIDKQLKTSRIMRSLEKFVGGRPDDEDDDDETSVSKDEDDDNQEDDDDQGDNDERTDSDNDGDDFVHPKFSTHDQDKRKDEEDIFDLRVQPPSHVETTDDEYNDEEIQDVNVDGDELDEEETNEEDEGDELYRDVNVNLEGRDIDMIDAQQTNVQTTQVIEDTHVIITSVNPEGQQQSSSVSSGFVSNMLNPSPDTGIDFIFNLNTESTSLVDVSVTTIAKPPLLSATTLPPPPTPLITHLQQTHVPAPAIVPSSSLQDLLNFDSLFGLKDKAQAKNDDLINKLDDNIKKIIKDQVKEKVKAQVSKILLKIKKTVNEQLEDEVLTRSSNESKTSHAIAANLSELELKKILIDKMESNTSISRSDEQKNLYKALVEAYKSDKLILDTYGDTVTLKRRRDDDDKDKEPSVRSNWGSKRRRVVKEPESTSAPKERPPGQLASQLKAKIEQVHEHQARSCSNHDREKEVLLVSETNQEAEWSLHQVDLQYLLFRTPNVRVLPNLWQCALAHLLKQTRQQTCDGIWTLQLTCQLSWRSFLWCTG